MIKQLILMALLPVLASAYTLDTGHALYANMKGIYVFDNRADDGDNIAGTGTMVGTTEDADGFDTPITQSFQSWHNGFGTGYTFCIWHSGMTLGAWESVFSIGDSTLSWQRYSSDTFFKCYHSGQGTNMSNFLTSEVASAGMLACLWDESDIEAYVDASLVGNTAMVVDPKTDSTTSEISLAGACTVTRIYIFDDNLSSDQLTALLADPDSIFESEEGASGAQIFSEDAESLAPRGAARLTRPRCNGGSKRLSGGDRRPSSSCSCESR